MTPEQRRLADEIIYDDWPGVLLIAKQLLHAALDEIDRLTQAGITWTAAAFHMSEICNEQEEQLALADKLAELVTAVPTDDLLDDAWIDHITLAADAYLASRKEQMG